MLAFVHAQQLEVSPAMTYAPRLMFCKQLMLGSVALLLSFFMHPLVASAIALFAGNGFYSAPNPLYYILPSYGAFDLYGDMLSGTLVSGVDVLWWSLYAAISSRSCSCSPGGASATRNCCNERPPAHLGVWAGHGTAPRCCTAVN